MAIWTGQARLAVNGAPANVARQANSDVARTLFLNAGQTKYVTRGVVSRPRPAGNLVRITDT